MAKTTSMPLTADEIVSIIRACKRNDVRRFQLDTLRINFGDVPEKISTNLSWSQKNIKPSPNEIGTDNPPEQLELEEFMSEFQSQQMILLNPMAYERDQLQEGTNEETHS